MTDSAAYTQRAMVTVLLAKMALRLGYKAGMGVDRSKPDWDPEWCHVLYIELPEGQVSWHFQPDDLHLTEGLPVYDPQWDGQFNGRDPNFIKGIKP